MVDSFLCLENAAACHFPVFLCKFILVRACLHVAMGRECHMLLRAGLCRMKHLRL